MGIREDLLKDIDTLIQKVYVRYLPDKGDKMLNWFVRKLNLLPDAIKKKNNIIYRGEV